MGREENIIKQVTPKPFVSDGSSVNLPNYSVVAGAERVNAKFNNAQVETLTASKVVVTDADKKLASGTNTDAEISTAYTHSQDNTQAHSDYLLNNASDSTTGVLSADGLSVTQTATTGYGLYVTRNLIAGSTDSSLARIHQDHASDDREALVVVQDAAANALLLDQNGTAIALNIDQEGATSGIYMDINASAALMILGNPTSSGGTYYFGRDVASATSAGPVLKVVQDNTGDDQVALRLTQDAVAIAFQDYVGTSAADATKNISTLTVAAIAGYVKIQINGSDYWMPFYNAPTA